MKERYGKWRPIKTYFVWYENWRHDKPERSDGWEEMVLAQNYEALADHADSLAARLEVAERAVEAVLEERAALQEWGDHCLNGAVSEEGAEVIATRVQAARTELDAALAALEEGK